MAKTKLDIVKETSLLSPEQEKQMEELLPQWVKELAADGTAVLRWNTEFLILIEELLRKDFGLSESDLVKLEGRIKEMLPHLHKMTLEGLVLLRPNDMAKALDIVDEFKMIASGKTKILQPSKSELIKKLSG